MTYSFKTTCVNSTAERIERMTENAKKVTYNELAKAIGEIELKIIFPTYKWNGKGLELKNDYAVSFYKSKYMGKPCYYIVHSMIEYIFTKD